MLSQVENIFVAVYIVVLVKIKSVIKYYYNKIENYNNKQLRDAPKLKRCNGNKERKENLIFV